MTAAAAFVAWLGVSIIVLADGRRGLALGLGLTAAAMAVIAWQSAGVLEGAALLAGGGVAALLRLRSGQQGWRIMPAGSTPRLVLCVASAFLALWIAASVTSGPGGALRFAVLIAIGLAAARAISTPDPSSVMTAMAALAMGVAAAGAAERASPGLALYVAAAIVAIGAAWAPVRTARAG